MSRWDGRECDSCGVKTGLLVVHYWRPARHQWERDHQPGGHYYRRARCINGPACVARREKADGRRRLRSQLIVVAEPEAPDAPRGQCRWCGEQLTGENASRRNYCYPDREGRNCRRKALLSRAWTGYDALHQRAILTETELRCADCGVLCQTVDGGTAWADGRPVSWEADHEVPLEDGGEHCLENLRCRCVGCHRRKTAREARARARARRLPVPGVQTLPLSA